MTSWHPLLFLLAFAHQSNANKTCPYNWTIDRNGEKCFWLTKPQRGATWSQSRSTCQEWGGDLAYIDSNETLRFAQVLIEEVHEPGKKKVAWLGAKRDEDGNVIWINGERLGYSNWHLGLPSEDSSKQCLVFWDVDSKWTLERW